MCVVNVNFLFQTHLHPTMERGVVDEHETELRNEGKGLFCGLSFPGKNQKLIISHLRKFVSTDHRVYLANDDS